MNEAKLNQLENAEPILSEAGHVAKFEYGYPHSNCGCASDYLLPVLQELLADFPADSIVVDAGCGNGSMPAALEKDRWKMHGIEISQSGLLQAKGKYPQFEFHFAGLGRDGCTLPMAGACDV